MIAGIELGGTKTVVAVGEDDGALTEQHRFPTTSPEETLAHAAEWISSQGTATALGIGSFGPVDINRSSATYGRMLRTPKKGWANFDLLAALSTPLGKLPCTLETDVNAALLAEIDSGAGQDCENAAYITIGTGIGGSLQVDGHILHGALHSELGHLNVPLHPDDTYPGHCIYHGQCLEGLACGPAIEARWGKPAHELPADHPAWDMESWYLAQGTLSLLAIASPTRVIIGGGVSQADDFHAKVESHLRTIAKGYFSTLDAHQPYVVPPQLGQNAGIQGALLLAQVAIGAQS